MSRRHRAEKRPILPDAKFGDEVVSKFMSCLMYAGKRSVAESIVYGAFDRIEARSGQQPVSVFHEALGNVKPTVEVRSAGLVVPHIRFRSRFAPNERRPWPFAG
jgi:small subunit ribosomal protein S7